MSSSNLKLIKSL